MFHKFPQHIDVLDMSAKAFTLSGILIHSGIPAPPAPPQLVSSVLSALSSYGWKEHNSEGALLIETTGNLFVFLASKFSPETVSDLAAIPDMHQSWLVTESTYAVVSHNDQKLGRELLAKERQKAFWTSCCNK